MKHPNAVVAWLAAHAIIALEQLLQRYAHVSLPSFWEAELIADTTTAVLWIGRHGIKAALFRCKAAFARLWAGPDPAHAKS